ncbi:unnamed protein product [Prunus armeniaca]
MQEGFITKRQPNKDEGFITKRQPNKDEVKVFVGNGVKVQVEFIGAVRIRLDSGFVLDLVDAVYVSSMTRNLISVVRLGFITKRQPNKDEVKVFVGNGVKVQVEFIGAVRIRLDFGFVLDLVDAVYVPSMTRNLISVARLVKSKLTLRFDEFGFSIFNNKELV